MIAVYLGTLCTDHSMMESYEEGVKVLKQGAEFIIHEELRDDPVPLYVIFLGPIFGICIFEESGIRRMFDGCMDWRGAWPKGEQEFNLGNDIHATNVVMALAIPLWPISPRQFSQDRLQSTSLWRYGQLLVQQMVDFNNALGDNLQWPKAEMWALGDSPAVSVLLDEHEYGYAMKSGPRINKDMTYVHIPKERMIRVGGLLDAC